MYIAINIKSTKKYSIKSTKKHSIKSTKKWAYGEVQNCS